MTHLVFAAALLSAAAGPAPGGSPGVPGTVPSPDEGRPPPRWWQYAEGLFAERLRSLTLAVELDDGRLSDAEARLAHYRDRAAALMRAQQVELDALDADYADYRVKTADGGAADPAAAERIDSASRRLYQPVAALLGEFAAEMHAVQRDAVRAAELAHPAKAPTPADPASAAVPTMPSPSATAGSEWADAAKVAELLGDLAEPTDAVRLEQELALHVGGREPTARQLALLDTYRAKLEEARSAKSNEWAKLGGAIAIVRRHPSAVRVSDVAAMRDHWKELLAGVDAVAGEFRAELRRRP